MARIAAGAMLSELINIYSYKWRNQVRPSAKDAFMNSGVFICDLDVCSSRRRRRQSIQD